MPEAIQAPQSVARTAKPLSGEGKLVGGISDEKELQTNKLK